MKTPTLPNGRRFRGDIVIEKGYDGKWYAKWYATNASLGPIEGFATRTAAEAFKRSVLAALTRENITNESVEPHEG